MNIFDGHEDKTPEELATELGISDLSLVEMAGKNAAEVLGVENIPNKIILKADVNRESDWDSKFEIADLELGMRIKEGKSLGVIDKINTALRNITIKREENLYSNYDFNEFDEKIEVYFMDRCKVFLEQGERKDVTSIESDIKKGVKLRIKNFTHHDLIVKYLSVDGDKKDGKYKLTCDNGAVVDLSSKEKGRYQVFKRKEMKRIGSSDDDIISIDRKWRNKYSGKTGIISAIDDTTSPVKLIQICIEETNEKSWVPLNDFFVRCQVLVPEDPDDEARVYGGQIQTTPSGI